MPNLRCGSGLPNPLPASVLPFPAVIRAKVVGKKLVKEGPFGTLVYTIKQMKVSDSSPVQEGSWISARRVLAKGGRVGMRLLSV